MTDAVPSSVSSRRLRELVAINRAIAGTLEYGEVLRLVVERCVELTQSRACALLLGEGDRLEVAAQTGLDPESASAFDAPLDERVESSLCRLFEARPDDILAVPVIRDESVRGLLVIARDEDGPPIDAEDRFLLKAMADQSAIALDHASRYYELWRETRAAHRELEKEAERKDEFLAMLAHELRNPLAAVTNAIAVLQTLMPEDEKLDHFAEAAARQSKLMARLLDDLFDVSRITRGKIRLDLGMVDLQEVLRQSVGATEGLVAERSQRLEIDLPETAAVVRGDRDRLIQVFVNLLGNAAKYTPEGGEITLSLATAGRSHHVSVRDNGIGIPEDLGSAVFDLFVQGERGSDRSAGGLGIGLTVVDRIVRMHGGEVEAHSAGAGRGTEMIVRLPAVTEAVMGERDPESDALEPDPEVCRQILLVEDNPDLAEALALSLRQAGHEVKIAHDGQTALDLYRSQPTELVLLDIGLPGMDGYEVARRLRSLGSSPPPALIALTGYGGERVRRMAKAAGFDRHLVKPVAPDILARIVAEASPVPSLEAVEPA